LNPQIKDTLMRFNESMATYPCTECSRGTGDTDTFNPMGVVFERNMGVDISPVVILLSYPKEHDKNQKKLYQTPDSQRFREWLRQANFSDFYMTNTVKCPKVDNQAPSKSQIIDCTNLYLRHEIELIKPKVILALGEKAIQSLYPKRPFEMIPNMLMKKHDLILPRIPHTIKLFATYHPAFIERGGDDALEEECIKLITKAFRENEQCHQNSSLKTEQ